MNKWQLLNALEEARTDNTKHTETISKLTTHVQGLWEEIEQKQFKINNRLTGLPPNAYQSQKT